MCNKIALKNVQEFLELHAGLKPDDHVLWCLVLELVEALMTDISPPTQSPDLVERELAALEKCAGKLDLEELEKISRPYPTTPDPSLLRRGELAHTELEKLVRPSGSEPTQPTSDDAVVDHLAKYVEPILAGLSSDVEHRAWCAREIASGILNYIKQRISGAALDPAVVLSCSDNTPLVAAKIAAREQLKKCIDSLTPTLQRRIP